MTLFQKDPTLNLSLLSLPDLPLVPPISQLCHSKGTGRPPRQTAAWRRVTPEWQRRLSSAAVQALLMATLGPLSSPWLSYLLPLLSLSPLPRTPLPSF